MTATTQRQLAKAVKKSRAAVRKWLEHDQWPFSKAGPWDVAKVKAWAAKTLEPADDLERALSPMAEARLELTKERTEGLRALRKLKTGEFHRLEDRLQQRVRQVIELRDKFLELPGQVAREQNFSAEQERAIYNHVVAILRHFAGQSPVPNIPAGKFPPANMPAIEAAPAIEQPAAKAD